MSDEEFHTAASGQPVLPKEIDATYLAQLGEGTIAYIRPVLAGEIAESVPQARELPPGTRLYALHGAAGAPIMLTSTREMALAQAHEQHLTTVSVH
ncbi:MAG: DUF1150 domain-containing protein [Rhodobiaceae bacterium]|nr:DUF1150 domain-containing protein [Rhodobiaceae bacterium]